MESSAPPETAATSAAGTQRRSLLGTLLRLFVFLLPLGFLAIIAALLAVLLLGPNDMVQERRYAEYQFKGQKHKVAIIRVEGTIVSSEGYIKKQIERVIEDTDVKAIVLRVNSPGGLVAPSDGIYHKLVQMRSRRKLPMVVSMGGIAASGGYYVSMAVGDTPDAIYAEPTTWTGSIGVIIPHYDFSGLLKEYNVKEDSIGSHPLKGMGSLTREMTEEERKIFQALVDDGFAQFKAVVLSGRPELSKEDLDKLATGQVYTCQQALANGLVDRQGYLEDAIVRAIELAREKDSQLKDVDFYAVEYVAPFSLMDLLLAKTRQDATPPEIATLNAAALLDLTVPRAYYLCTWAPGLRPAR